VKFEFHLNFIVFMHLRFCERFLVYDKGEVSKGINVWFCEKNDSQCVTKVENKEERNLCSFVKRMFFNCA
jgi:hypothetical protein